jgi:haloacetate dehalogenase
MDVPITEHHTSKINGIKMHYVLAGDGPPVVLLHDFPETWFAWRHQIAALSSQHRLIVPDQRGYGATEKSATSYDKRTMARDIHELMRHLGIAKAPIVGHDRGARVATRFARSNLSPFPNAATTRTKRSRKSSTAS